MRRALPLVVTLLIGLAACRGEDARQPFTDSRIPPGLDHRFYPPQGWAWGLIQIGKAPPVRYGVAGPASAPKGQVIILPDLGETAEAWFETANDLIARGYVVWVLEGSSQGGSGRYLLPRDVVHAPSLDPDVAAVMVAAAKVSGQRPRYLIASGAATPIAVRAAALGLQLDGMVLIDAPLTPRADHAEPTTDRLERRIGLGFLRPAGGHGWRREDGPQQIPAGEAPHRRWLSQQWQIANPDLRMGDPSVGWNFAYAEELAAARAAWPRVTTRTLAIGQDICRGGPNCARIAQPAAHDAFKAAILGFIDPSSHGVAPAPPRVTLDPNE